MRRTLSFLPLLLVCSRRRSRLRWLPRSNARGLPSGRTHPVMRRMPLSRIHSRLRRTTAPEASKPHFANVAADAVARRATPAGRACNAGYLFRSATPAEMTIGQLRDRDALISSSPLPIVPTLESRYPDRSRLPQNPSSPAASALGVRGVPTWTPTPRPIASQSFSARPLTAQILGTNFTAATLSGNQCLTGAFPPDSMGCRTNAVHRRGPAWADRDIPARPYDDSPTASCCDHELLLRSSRAGILQA